jgi:hypothetical protein
MSSDERTRRLSADEIAALTFAARRQLTRWANRSDLQPREQVKRATLIRAVRVLDDRVLAHGCRLCAICNRPSDDRQSE